MKKNIINKNRLRKIVKEEIENIFGELDDVEDLEPMTYDYLFKQHEGLPDEYFEPTDIPYDPNEFAMYTIPSNIDYKYKISEGLTRTYPTKTTLNFVCNNLTKRGYPIKPNIFTINCPNDDGTIYGHILLKININYLNQEINDILIKSFNTCGYHLGKTFNRLGVNGNKLIVFQFEPKFQDNVTNKNMGKYLFHVTTANAAKKIMQQGFCPSNRTKNGFKYDSRCYFFTIYNKQLFSAYMKEANKRNNIGNNSFNYDFVILTIDRTLIEDVTFFTDPNFASKTAVFTYSNVPPSAIVKQENL